MACGSLGGNWRVTVNGNVVPCTAVIFIASPMGTPMSRNRGGEFTGDFTGGGGDGVEGFGGGALGEAGFELVDGVDVVDAMEASEVSDVSVERKPPPAKDMVVPAVGVLTALGSDMPDGSSTVGGGGFRTGGSGRANGGDGGCCPKACTSSGAGHDGVCGSSSGCLRSSWA